MACQVITDAFLSVGGVDLSAFVRSVELNHSADAVECTAMGDTFRSREPGLEDWSVSVSFKNSTEAGGPDATLEALVATSAAIVLRSASEAVSSTNPEWTGNVIITDYMFGGRVGELSELSVTWPGNGALGRATS